MFLPGRGGLTGGTVIPSGNPLDVLRRDHHAVKRRVITSSLREGKSWLIKPGRRMLFSLGRRIVYERETQTRKSAHNGSATQPRLMDGKSLVKTRWCSASEVARARETVENNPTPQNNSLYSLHCQIPKGLHTSCKNKLERKKKKNPGKLNLDRDGNKLWQLTKAMNDEIRSSPVMIQRDQTTVTGKRVANCFTDSYEQVSNLMIPNNRKQKVHDEIENHQTDQDSPEYMRAR